MHEDRVRPAVRASSPGAASTPGSSRAAARGRSGDRRPPRRGAAAPRDRRDLRLRDAGRPRRRATRPGHRRRATCRSTRRPPYVFEDVDHAAALFNLQTFGYIYSRITNPTVAALEERVAALEGGRAAVAAASGHAAQLLAFYTLLEPGDHVVAARQLYGGSLTQLRHTFAAPRLDVQLRGCHGPVGGRAARSGRGPRPSSSRSLANPGGVVVDLEALATIAHAASIPLIVDNTLATPVPVPPVRVGRRPRRPLADQVPVRPRHVDGRDRRGVRPVRLGGERQVPVPRPDPTRPTTGSTSSRPSATSGSR